MENMSDRSRNAYIKTGIVFPIILLLAFPLIFKTSPYILHILILTCCYGIISTSWNLQGSFLRQISLSHTSFAAIAAYTSAILSNPPSSEPAGLGLSVPLACVVGIAVGTATGFGVGMLCLRFRGPYLSLLTISFNQFVYYVLLNESWLTRGEMGFFPPRLFGIYQSEFIYSYFAIVLLLFVVFAAKRFMDSKFGLAVRALGDDEMAASTVGIDVVKVKIIVYSLSSFLATLGGVAYAHYTFLNTNFASLGLMFFIIGYVLIGGFGTFLGPLVGTIICVPMAEYLRGTFGMYHLFIFAIILLLIVRFMPHGIIGALQNFIAKRGIVLKL